MSALCFVPEGDGYIITGSGVFSCVEALEVHSSTTADIRCQAETQPEPGVASYLYPLPGYLLALRHAGTNLQSAVV